MYYPKKGKCSDYLDLNRTNISRILTFRNKHESHGLVIRDQTHSGRLGNVPPDADLMS